MTGAFGPAAGSGDTTGNRAPAGGAGGAADGGGGASGGVADAALPQSQGAAGAAGSGGSGTASAPALSPNNPSCDGLHVAVLQDPSDPIAVGQAPTLSCRYTMPADASAYMPERVGFQYNMYPDQYPDQGLVTTVLHVRDASACDPMKGGWYYDLSFDAGRIVVCMQSCHGEGAELVLGCPVPVQP